MIFNPKQQVIAEKIKKETLKSHWKDWKWQLRHAVKDVESFEKLTDIHFDETERAMIEETVKTFPLAITPYYLSLIDTNNFKNDPIFKQSFPDVRECQIGNHEMSDPLHEDADSPVPGITHRYPDRVLFHVSNVCAMYCRHCTRKRKVGDVEAIPTQSEMMKGIEYIQQTPQIRDVLISGGDALLLSDEKLDWILTELRKIPHIEIVRIGTRTPVVLPYRITDELVEMLKKHHPVWINTHFNHPKEITTSSKHALRKLADAGIPLGNQSVLLAGINDCSEIIKALNHKLVANRVRPYYLYQCDLSEGLDHFRTPVGKGIEIIERLIGHTSGFAVPTYVIDAPGGGGKIPIMPQYLISFSADKVILRNYEGVITTYQEPKNYQQESCEKACEDCKLDLSEEHVVEHKVIGIEKLLSDSQQTISLVPTDTDRLSRRTSEKAGNEYV